MPGRPGGSARGGGGARGGAAPYAPGENDVLKWKKFESLQKLLQREEGSKKPLLVLVYDSNLSEDCCAANFERAVLRYEHVVKLTQNFLCFKFEKATTGEAWKQFGLAKKKPALLVFDAEGGIITKHQKCMNPQQYVKVLKGAMALNDKRVRYKEKYLARHRDVRTLMDKGDYAKALRSIDRMLKNRHELMGSVLEYVQSDYTDLELKAQEMLVQAQEHRDEKQLLDAYRLYKEISDEFAKLQEVGKSADRCAREVRSELRKMGVSVR